MKKIGKILCVFLFLVIALALVLAGMYFFTRKSANEYLDSSFVFYGTIDSIQQLYDATLDLSALQTVLEHSDLKQFRKNLDDFRSGGMARSFLMRQLLKIKTDLQTYSDNSFIVALDLGPLSVATRFVPLLNYFLNIEGVDISTIRRGKNTYYEALLSNGAKYYFSIRDNLLFFSAAIDRLEYADNTFGSSKALKFNREVASLKNSLTGPAQVRFYVTASYFEKIIPFLQSPEVREMITLGEIAGCSLFISEEAVDLQVLTALASKNDQINAFLRYDPTGLDVQPWVPSSVNLLASVKAESAKSLYETFMQLQSEKNRQNITKSLRMLSALNLTFDEAIAWIGNEAGAFYVGGSSEPVIFLKIGDERAKNNFLDKLTSSAVFNKDESLVLNSVLISRIVLPDFFRFILSSFVKDVNIAQPYYIEENGFMFFSPNAENLLHITAAKKDSRFLASDPDFTAVKRVSGKGNAKNPNVLAYYNIQNAFPSFIAPDSLIGQLIKLYGNGLASVRFSERDLSLNIALQGAVKPPVEPLIGYPRELGKSVAAAALDRNVYVGELRGAKTAGPQLVYVDGEGLLHTANLFGETQRSYDVGKGSRAAVYQGKKSWITVFNREGRLAVFDGDLKQLDGYPLLLSECKTSFFPVFFEGNLWLYNAGQAGLTVAAVENPQPKLFPYHFDFDVSQPPFFAGNFVTLAPRNLFGEVFLFSKDGALLPGWPVEGGGNFLQPPQIIDGKAPRVLFLTQNGRLNLWNADGSAVDGFPLSFSGNFFAAPLVFNFDKTRQAICLIDSAGVARIVLGDGQLLAERKLNITGGRDLMLCASDIDGDGSDEILLYGASNLISAFDAFLAPVPGFPVAGNTRPYFLDTDKDGKKELFSVGVDGKLNAYKIYSIK